LANLSTIRRKLVATRAGLWRSEMVYGAIFVAVYAEDGETYADLWSGSANKSASRRNGWRRAFGYIRVVQINGNYADRVAICSKAWRSSVGIFFPRFAARRSTPAAATGESQYLFGTSDCTTCHNEHSAPSLGDSEISAVQYSPTDFRTIPTVGHFTDDGSEVGAAIA
jgi:hypothetical protein